MLILVLKIYINMCLTVPLNLKLTNIVFSTEDKQLEWLVATQKLKTWVTHPTLHVFYILHIQLTRDKYYLAMNFIWNYVIMAFLVGGACTKAMKDSSILIIFSVQMEDSWACTNRANKITCFNAVW